jgi:hypothetical protein
MAWRFQKKNKCTHAKAHMLPSMLAGLIFVYDKADRTLKVNGFYSMA